MKGFICNVCGYVSINGSAPDKCPACGAPKTSFEEKSDAIKIPADAKIFTDFEKKHVPNIIVAKQCGLIPGCMDVNVKVGEITHPMEEKHFILHIDFYLDNQFISRFILTPKINPAAGIHLKNRNGKLSVVALCNLHGAWISEVKL